MATIIERDSLIRRARQSPALQEDLNELCKRDIIFWFEHFCWTFNPRVPPYHFPFNLYLFQEKFIRLLCECIDTGEYLIVEKSRDMGLSWMIMLVFQWYWLYHDGSSMHCGSKKEDDVDQKGNISSLIQKCRYNYEFLPTWMAPPIKKGGDGHMKILHPERQGNTITGEAATPDFCRSQRYKAVLMDELARHPFGQAAYESASQATDCIIGVWTPYGKANHAYTLREGKNIEWVDIGDKSKIYLKEKLLIS